LLGIRIGEGYLTNVTFKSIYDQYEDNGVNADYSQGDITDSAFISKNYDSYLDKNIDFDLTRLGFVEGGGYFFGMVEDENGDYRGLLAMDEDGEGVTKLIELADVSSYDEFSPNYIGENDAPEGLLDYYDASGFSYNLTAYHYPTDFSG
jgi:hypothetical protein